MLDDLRYALRVLKTSPAFAAVAILSLALGIGANTAIFALIDTVLLKTLPVEKPEQLMLLRSDRKEANATYTTNPMWEALRDRQTFFDGVFAYSSQRFNIANGGEAQYIRGLWASGDFFRTLGIRPAAGRLFTIDDDKRGCAGIAVLHYDYWQSRFGGDRAAVGKTMAIEGKQYEIIGVTQPGFFGVEVGSKFDVAVPICTEPLVRGENSSLDRRSNWWLEIMGRPKPGLTAAQVNAGLETISPAVMEASLPNHWRPNMQDGFKKRVWAAAPAAQGSSAVRNQMRNPLLVLIVVTGLVLLIACANLANLLLARATARQREIAIRQALGASRGRLVRLLLTESLLLSGLGAIAGLIMARFSSALLVGWMSTSRNRLELDLPLDWRILAFTAGVAVLTAVLFGLAPAFRATGLAPNSALKETGRSHTARRGRFALGRMLVAFQIALSLLLVAGAGLFLRTFVNLITQDPGFRTESVLIAETDLSKSGLPQDQRLAVFHDLLESVRQVPGVVAAAQSDITPISGSAWNMEATTPATKDLPERQRVIYWNAVSPNYFTTLGTPLLAGRDFTDADRKGAPRVTIINETAAKKFFPGENPIGKVLTWGSFGPDNKPTPFEVIGLVKDAKYRNLREATLPTGYSPLVQEERTGQFSNFSIRTRGPAAQLIAPVRDAIGAKRKDASIEFKIFETQVAESLMRERLLASLSGFFGALALLLASVGLYGVMSYLVNQRRNEIGIRMALGAQRGNVLWLILKEAGVLIVAGLTIGLASALLTMRYLESQLFGLKPNDAVTLTAAIAILFAVGALAAFLPARRAAALDPMTTLREE
jgi:predicted permease